MLVAVAGLDLIAAFTRVEYHRLGWGWYVGWDFVTPWRR